MLCEATDCQQHDQKLNDDHSFLLDVLKLLRVSCTVDDDGSLILYGIDLCKATELERNVLTFTRYSYATQQLYKSIKSSDCV